MGLDRDDTRVRGPLSIPDRPGKHRRLEPPHVFISYSHADRKWLQRLQVHVRPLERLGTITPWDDTRIKAGSHWREEIEKELDHARVAVLLVSADFLASEFITTNEVPRLLVAAESRGTLILPLIISPCRFEQTPSLSRFQAVNRPSQPLVGLRRAKQEEVFVALANRIESALLANQGPPSRSEKRRSPSRAIPPLEIPRRDLEAFIRKSAEAQAASRIDREVSFSGFTLRQLTNGGIEVWEDGLPKVPVKPVLRRLAAMVGVDLLNSNGNPRNTRQLGGELIKKLGG